jgi:hypothetical protein
VASLRTACSVGPPTVSDTISPPDQLSVDGDYVFIFGTSTVIFSYQQNGKTFAIRQPNDRAASVSTRFLVFLVMGWPLWCHPQLANAALTLLRHSAVTPFARGGGSTRS